MIPVRGGNPQLARHRQRPHPSRLAGNGTLLQRVPQGPSGHPRETGAATRGCAVRRVCEGGDGMAQGPPAQRLKFWVLIHADWKISTFILE